jgi:hypothetical protein
MPAARKGPCTVAYQVQSAYRAHKEDHGLLAHAGTVLNYVLDKGLNKATILFPGVACFALAVVAGALTHVFNEEHQNKRKRLFDDSVHRHVVGNATIGFEHGAGALLAQTKTCLTLL